MTAPAIQLSGVSKEFATSSGTTLALDHIDLERLREGV